MTALYYDGNKTGMNISNQLSGTTVTAAASESNRSLSSSPTTTISAQSTIGSSSRDNGNHHIYAHYNNTTMMIDETDQNYGKIDSPLPSSSAGPLQSLSPPSSPSSSSTTKNDKTFEPTIDMMVNDFDDEQTLEEEEALAAQEADEDPKDELTNLQKESEMSIEELLALYNVPPTSVERSADDGVSIDNDIDDETDNYNKININSGGGCSGNSNINKSLKKHKRKLKKNKKIHRKYKNIFNDDVYEEQFYNDVGGGDGGEDGGGASDNNINNDDENCNNDQNVEDSYADDDNDEDNDDVDDDDDNNEGDDVNDDDDRDEHVNINKHSKLCQLYPETYGKDSDKENSLNDGRASDDEEDDEYTADEDECRKTIMVGNEYQAVIPEGLKKYDDVLPYENEDKLVWDVNRLNENEIETYLRNYRLLKRRKSSGIASIPCGAHLRDDEQALYLLLQCGYSTEEALRRKRLNFIPADEKMSAWSEEECRNFESGIRIYGKDFYTIQQTKVQTRSVGELVQFYYIWKKTERHDIFANKARLDKKKYSLNPGITDFMDRFIDEQENNETMNNVKPENQYHDRSLSPGNSSFLYNHHQLQQREMNTSILKRNFCKSKLLPIRPIATTTTTTTTSSYSNIGGNNVITKKKLINQKRKYNNFMQRNSQKIKGIPTPVSSEINDSHSMQNYDDNNGGNDNTIISTNNKKYFNQKVTKSDDNNKMKGISSKKLTRDTVTLTTASAGPVAQQKKQQHQSSAQQQQQHQHQQY